MERQTHARISPAMRMVMRTALGMLATASLAGCATNRLESWHEKHIARTERFYPTGPAREKGNQLYVQGVTKRIKGYHDPYFDPAPVLEQHPSYLMLEIERYGVKRWQWMDPGSLPDDVLAASPVPVRACGIEVFQSSDFSPELHALYAQRHYSSGDVAHHILFQSPEDAAEDKWRNHGGDMPRPERRLPAERSPADWVLYPIVYAAALSYDVVTSPLQFLGLVLAFRHFSI